MSAGAFEDKRVRVEFMDARAFLESSDQTFDIIIIDISEPIEEGPAYLLFTQEFYKIVFDRLTEHGALAVQAGTISLAGLECFATIGPAISSQTENILYASISDVSLCSFNTDSSTCFSEVNDTLLLYSREERWYVLYRR